MPVEKGPPTYPEPRLEPGVHFHHLPDLATIRGYMMAWDAGNPSADVRKEAREVEELNNPRGMAAAIVEEVNGAVIGYTVVRGPATSQEGEAVSMSSHQVCPSGNWPASGGQGTLHMGSGGFPLRGGHHSGICSGSQGSLHDVRRCIPAP